MKAAVLKDWFQLELTDVPMPVPGPYAFLNIRCSPMQPFPHSIDPGIAEQWNMIALSFAPPKLLLTSKSPTGESEASATARIITALFTSISHAAATPASFSTLIARHGAMP